MSFLQAIILGIIQGLTEFLPVSSSAHLVLVPFFLGWVIDEEYVLPFDVLVQLGTLVAVIIYFRNDLWDIAKAFLRGLVERQPFATQQSRMGWFIILATIPAGLAGLLIKDLVEAAFNSPVATALFLFVTAFLLLFSEMVGKRNRCLEHLTWKDALWIGGAQAFALFPGISRSGSTMAGGISRNLDRASAGRFSFLMSIPIMLVAGGYSLLDLGEVPNLAEFLPVLVVGFVTAAVVGYLSIHWLLSYLVRHSLRSFAIYCAVIGTATLIVSFL